LISLGGVGCWYDLGVYLLLMQTEHLLILDVKKPAFKVSDRGFWNMA
jgi:hypothetical protein